MGLLDICREISAGDFTSMHLVEDAVLERSSELVDGERACIAECITAVVGIVERKNVADEKCGKFISICSSLDQPDFRMSEKVFTATYLFLDWAKRTGFQKYNENASSLKLCFDFVQFASPDFNVHLLREIEGDLFESFRCLDPEDGDKFETMLKLYEQILTRITLHSDSTEDDTFYRSVSESFERFCNKLSNEITETVPEEKYLDGFRIDFKKVLKIFLKLQFAFDFSKAHESCEYEDSDGGSLCDCADYLHGDTETYWLILTAISYSSPTLRKRAHRVLKALIIMEGECSEELVWNIHNIGIDGNNELEMPIWTINPDMVSNWEQYVTFLDMLETNKTETPDSSKLFALFVDEDSSSEVEDLLVNRKKESYSLPICWLLAILNRMLTHEDRVVQKKGLLLTISIHPSIYMVNDAFFNWFIRNGLFHALQDTQLYNKSEGSHSIHSDCPYKLPIVSGLVFFLQRCGDRAADEPNFVSNLIKAVTEMKWGEVPLMTASCAIFCMNSKEHLNRNVVISYLKALTCKLRDLREEVRKIVLNNTIDGLIKFPLDTYLNEFLDFLLFAVDEEGFRRGNDGYIATARAMALNFEKSPLPFPLSLNKVLPRSFRTFPTIGALRKKLGSNKRVALYTLLILDGLKYDEEEDLCEDLLKKYMKKIFEIIKKMSNRLTMDNSEVLFVVEFFQIWMKIINEECALSFEFLGKKLVPHAAQLSHMVGNLLGRSVLAKDHSSMPLLLDCAKGLYDFSESFYDRGSSKKVSQMMKKLRTQLVNSSLETLRGLPQSSTLQLSSADLIKYSTTWTVCECCLYTIDHEDREDMDKLNEILEHLKLDQTIERPTTTKDDNGVNVRWSKEASEFSRVQFKFLLFVLESYNVQQLRLDFNRLLSVVTEKLEAASPEDIRVLLEISRYVIKEALAVDGGGDSKNTSKISTCLLTMWRRVLDFPHQLSHGEICAFFGFATFQREVIGNLQLRPTLTRILDQIFAAGPSKPYLITSLTTTLPEQWRSEYQFGRKSLLERKKTRSYLPSAFDLMGYYVRILSFASPPPLESWLFYETAEFFHKLDKFVLDEHPVCDDMLVTMHNLHYINGMDVNNFKYGNALLKALLKHDVAICKEKHQSHHNSSLHHRRHKLWTCLVFLYKFVKKEESEEIIKLVIERLSKEMQNSVRHLGEWLFTLLLIRFPSQITLLKKELAKPYSDKKRVIDAINSNMIVGLLYGKSKLTKETWNCEKQYLLDLVNDVLPWCMNQQISIRLHAQAILLEINNLFVKFGNLKTLKKSHPCLETCLRFADSLKGNEHKNWVKIKNNFVIFHLHPIDGLSLSTLLVEIPRLCFLPKHMCFDENVIGNHMYSVDDGPVYINDNPLPKSIPMYNKCCLGAVPREVEDDKVISPLSAAIQRYVLKRKQEQKDSE